MNTYGKTKCPQCQTPNSMFRPLEVCREMPAWDACKCFECGHEYKHSEQNIDVFKNPYQEMRATSPLDQIQAFEHYNMPQPKFSIGMEVDRACLNVPYYRKSLLRHELKKTRQILKQHIGKLHEYNKEQIRKKMSMFDKSEKIEIAGIAPFNSLVVGNVSNQCYIRDGQCHGGVTYNYYLLFRITDKQDRKLVYISDIPIILEGHLKTKKSNSE